MTRILSTVQEFDNNGGAMSQRNILIAISLLFMASAATAQMRCESVLGAMKTEAEIISFIEGKNALKGGEYNAYVLKYFETNLERLSPTGAIHLINALVPEGAMSRASQFTAFVSKAYAREKMIRTFVDQAQDRLTDKEIEYFSDLLHYGR